MSKQREAMKQALHALQTKGEHHRFVYDAMKALAEALAEPEQKPVAWAHQPPGMSTIYSIDPISGPDSIPLYAAPPARKPLTDEEIDNLELPPNGCTMRELVRVVERAHGIDGGHDCWR